MGEIFRLLEEEGWRYSADQRLERLGHSNLRQFLVEHRAQKNPVTEYPRTREENV